MVGRVSPPIQIGKPLPKHPSYADDQTARAFWRLSFRVGRKYVDGLDAKGEAVIPKHEREEEGYARRKRLTKPRNHAGPIIRRYNDHVFRRKAKRDDAGDEVYQLLLKDTDGHGTPIDEFMKRTLRTAQVEREAYLMPDSTAPADGRQLTRAEAQASGVRPFLRRLTPDAVPWWRDYDGMMVECIVLLVDADGVPFGRHYDAKAVTDIRFKLDDKGHPDREYTVAAIGETRTHECGGCPVVRLRPLFDEDDECAESQIAPLAELQQSIAWHLSLLTEEIANVTFSQMVASGIDAAQVKDAKVGNNRLICLPNPAAKIDMIGADSAQAATISTRIEDDTRELYRIAGVDAGSSTDGAGAPESGLAKAFRHNDLAANLSALALACEEAENLAMARLFAGMGKPAPAPAEYPRDFDLPQLSDELNETIRAVTTMQLPMVLRRAHVQRYASRNFELSDEEKAELETELATMQDEPTDDPPAGRTFGT